MVEHHQIAFIGWNPFQFLHVKDLAKSIPGCIFVVEKRKEYLEEFPADFFSNVDIPVMIWDRAKMPTLDGVFDIIVCQTPFFRIEAFEKTKIVMIQYGYAKEPHNYGAWRSLADLCLTYGDYATKKISYFCTAISVGNPRYDSWIVPEKILACKRKYSGKLYPKLKTILYVPTWGDLSSIDRFLDSILNLSENYNVILKLHHNTDLLENTRKNKINERVNCYGANDDLIELINIADVVISDYSGAIFDAVYFNKPIILLGNKCDIRDMSLKMDAYSLEYSERENIGYEVYEPDDLLSAVKHVINNIDFYSKMHNSLKGDLFIDTDNSVGLAINALNRLYKGEFSPNQSQLYVRQISKELLSVKRQLQISLKNNKS